MARAGHARRAAPRCGASAGSRRVTRAAVSAARRARDASGMRRLTRVAEVASAVRAGVSNVAKNVVFGAPEGAFEDDGAEPLLDSLANGALADERTGAACALRDKLRSSDVAKDFIAAHAEKMFETLRDTTDEDELVRATLEALHAATSGSEGRGREKMRRAIATSERYVAQLVSELRGTDFYSKLHAAQTLREVSETAGEELRASTARDPTAVPTLMDAMKENEVIRNEALLLLVALTKGDEELQKIVAFEGAFERALSVIREEGGVDGGVVVQDCLELCNNLLRDNPSNQTLFRENGFVRSIPGLAAVEREIGNGGMRGISAQKAANALCALETVHLLVSPEEAAGKRKHVRADDQLEEMMKEQRIASCKANQSELAKTGMVEILVRASLGDSAVNAVSVRIAALRALAALVRDHEENQTALFSATADRAGTVTEPALLSCGRTALHSSSPAERAAAGLVLGASMRGNRDGQLLLVSTLAPTGLGNDGEEASLGGLIASALATKSLGVAFDQASAEAASILREMLHKNDQAKTKALRVNLQPVGSRSSASELLMPRCVRQLAVTHTNEDDKPKVERLQSILLRLLIVWLYGCRPAVDAFLSSPGHLPAIADLARAGGSTGSTHVAALACVVLGCCLLEKAGGVLDVVSARVGLQSFFMKWEAMTSSKEYLEVAKAPTLPKPLTRANASKLATQTDGAEDLPPGAGLYDHDITLFINELEERVKESIMSMYAKPSAGEDDRVSSSVSKRDGEDDASYLKRLQDSLRDCENELADVRASNVVLAEQLLGVSSSKSVSHGGAVDSAPVEDGMRGAHSNEALQAAVDAAKRASAGEIASLKRDLEETKRLAEERQESLTSLSSAYNGLEAEVYRLESEADGLRAKLHESDAGSVAAPDTAALDVARDAGRIEGRRIAEAEAEVKLLAAVDTAVKDAVKDANDAHEAELNDLLACLGQEEASKDYLFQKLLDMGADAAQLEAELANLVVDDPA